MGRHLRTYAYSVTDLPAFAYTEIVIDPLAADFLTTLLIGGRNDFGFLEIDDVAVRQIPELSSMASLGATLLLGWVVYSTRRHRAARST